MKKYFIAYKLAGAFHVMAFNYSDEIYCIEYAIDLFNLQWAKNGATFYAAKEAIVEAPTLEQIADFEEAKKMREGNHNEKVLSEYKTGAPILVEIPADGSRLVVFRTFQEYINGAWLMQHYAQETKIEKKAAAKAKAVGVEVQIEAVKDFAVKNYNKSAWAYVVECFTDADISEQIAGAKTAKGAIEKMGAWVKLKNELQSNCY